MTPHNRVHCGVVALAIVLTASVASAAEAAWPKDSASGLSEFMTLLRFRIYADHCSAMIPRLKSQFESLLEGFDNHLHTISKELLASDVFKGMKDQPVPAVIIDAFRDSFDDTRHNFERQDAAVACPKTLKNLGEMGDDSLKSDLAQMLTAIQTMIRNLEKQARLTND